MADNVEDPIVLYVIIRQSLSMGVDKTCAQVGHAVKNILFNYFKAQIIKAKIHDDGFPLEEVKHINSTTEWLGKGSTIAVICADETNWETIKAEYGKNCFVVKESSSIETAITFWPQHISEFTDTVKTLPPIK